MFENHVAVQAGNVWAGKMNDEVKILVNPFDPSFIVQLAGAIDARRLWVALLAPEP